MILVILVCGLPGAGKSSFLRDFVVNTTTTKWKLLNEHDDDDDAMTAATTMEIIEYDELVDQEILRNGSSSSSSGGIDDPKSITTDDETTILLHAWKTSRRRAESKLMERIMKNAYQQPQKTITILFLDDNFYLRSMRKQIYRILVDCQNQIMKQQSTTTTTTSEKLTESMLHFGIVCYDTPLDVCMERNQSRHRPVPDHVIQSMHQRFEIPGTTTTSSNYIPYWEKSSFVLHLDGTKPTITHNVPVLQTFVQEIMVTAASVIPVTPRTDDHIDQERIEMARVATRECIPQRIDLFLRKCVSETVQIRRAVAQTANEKRKACLQQQQSMTQQTSDRMISTDDRAVWLELFLSPITCNEWLTESEKDALRRKILAENEH